MIFQLSMVRLRCTYQATSTVRFPAYAGSTWRGAFGHALRRTVCITREPECAGCLLWRSCVYSQIFETPAGNEPLLKEIMTAPRPYILQPLAISGKQYHAGDTFVLYMTLLGQAIAQLPYMIHALQQAGERGLGKQGGQCALVSVAQESVIGSEDWQSIYHRGGILQPLPANIPAIPPMPSQVRVRLLTPFRAVQDGKLLNVQRFHFQPFMVGIIRRIALLHAHGAGVELNADFKALSQLAEQVSVTNVQLRWYEWERYSNRQQRAVQMGGLLGEFTVPLQGLDALWDWLWFGQWVHVGKGAVMGMGEYRLDASS
ncbi:MAG: CRISPR system precrRNA processing endoribonuclease RAMP protein Cas6 [Thiothrix sp.]